MKIYEIREMSINEIEKRIEEEEQKDAAVTTK